MEARPTEGPLRVLVVDDAPDVRAVIAALLEDRGFQVTTASTASEALRRLDDGGLDVVLLDVHLPDANGDEILAQIRRTPRLRALPVIVISASREAEYDLVDVFDYLPKPVEFERLFEDLRYIEARRRLEGPSWMDPEAGGGDRSAFGETDFESFATILRERAGLNIPPRRGKELARAVETRIRALLKPSLDSYRRLIEGEGGEEELKKLLLMLTVGETYFFRNSSHFSALLGTVLPELKERFSPDPGRRTIRMLSAGCSTGEEAYSLAIAAREVFPSVAGWRVEVVAVDINNRSLNLARRGLYGRSSFRGLDERIRQRNFEPEGDGWRVRQVVRDMVDFRYCNLRDLADGPAPSWLRAMDLIFCRNVLIYFDPDTIRHALERFRGLLEPGGYLFLGHAESSLQQTGGFDMQFDEGVFYFRRGDEGAPTLRRESPSGPVSAHADGSGADFDHECRRGIELFDGEDLDGAHRVFERILKLNPAFQRARVGLALILASQGRERQSLELVEEALQHEVGMADGYFLRASLHERLGRIEGVFEDYQRAVLWDPGFVMARVNLGFAAERLGRRDAARRTFAEVVDLLEGRSGIDADCRLSGGMSRDALVALARDKGA